MNLAPVRDYVFVDDAVAAISNACDMSLKESVTIANLGRGVGVSVKQLAECILRVVGRDIEVLETGQPDRPQALDVHELIADPSAAGRNLNWFPQTTLDDGIRRMISDLQKAVAA
jgi:nucleoside-diphosphate-sugar epimerase